VSPECYKFLDREKCKERIISAGSRVSIMLWFSGTPSFS
jgi:hypothetical protein